MSATTNRTSVNLTQSALELWEALPSKTKSEQFCNFALIGSITSKHKISHRTIEYALKSGFLQQLSIIANPESSKVTVEAAKLALMQGVDSLGGDKILPSLLTPVVVQQAGSVSEPVSSAVDNSVDGDGFLKRPDTGLAAPDIEIEID